MKIGNHSHKRLPALDGIRGIAIALVLLYHLSGFAASYGPGGMLWKAFVRILASGWLGVDVFFVLSGYLITGIILSESGGKPSRRFWLNFYRRRAFRILPAFIVVLLPCLIIAHYTDARTILLYFFFAANWAVLYSSEIPFLSHVWSLAIEEQFYFFWPAISARFNSQVVFRTAFCIAGLSEITRLSMYLSGVNGWVIYKVTFSRLDGIAIGAALAAGMQIPSVVLFLRKYWRVALISAISSLLLVFCFLRFQLWSWDARAQIFGIPSAAIAVAAVIFAVSMRRLPAILDSVLTGNVLTYLGRRSYGLYLIHAPVFFAIAKQDLTKQRGVLTFLLIAVASVGISLFLAELSWRLIEQPAQRFRGKLESESGQNSRGLATKKTQNWGLAPGELATKSSTNE